MPGALWSCISIKAVRDRRPKLQSPCLLVPSFGVALSLSLTGSRTIPSFCAPLAVSCLLSSSVLYLQGTGHLLVLWGCLGVLTNTSFGWLTWWCPYKALAGTICLALLGVCSPAHPILAFSWVLFKTYSKCLIWWAMLVSLQGLCSVCSQTELIMVQ